MVIKLALLSHVVNMSVNLYICLIKSYLCTVMEQCQYTEWYIELSLE